MRPYQALRSEMYVHGISRFRLARALRIGEATLSRKMNGRSAWTLDECWRVLELLGKSAEALPVLFPYKGRNEEEYPCRKSGNRS